MPLCRLAAKSATLALGLGGGALGMILALSMGRTMVRCKVRATLAPFRTPGQGPPGSVRGGGTGALVPLVRRGVMEQSKNFRISDDPAPCVRRGVMGLPEKIKS